MLGYLQSKRKNSVAFSSLIVVGGWDYICIWSLHWKKLGASIGIAPLPSKTLQQPLAVNWSLHCRGWSRDVLPATACASPTCLLSASLTRVLSAAVTWGWPGYFSVNYCFSSVHTLNKRDSGRKEGVCSCFLHLPDMWGWGLCAYLNQHTPWESSSGFPCPFSLRKGRKRWFCFSAGSVGAVGSECVCVCSVWDRSWIWCGATSLVFPNNHHRVVES